MIASGSRLMDSSGPTGSSVDTAGPRISAISAVVVPLRASARSSPRSPGNSDKRPFLSSS